MRFSIQNNFRIKRHALFFIVFLMTLTTSKSQVLDSATHNVYNLVAFSRPYVNEQFLCKLDKSSDSISENIKKQSLSHRARTYFKEMQFIIGGRRTIGANRNYTPTKNDTTLLFYTQTKEFDAESFLLCNHEVTNKEYREFTNWVRDSIARSILSAKDSRYLNKNNNINHLNWQLPINWDDSTLRKNLFMPDNERFYRRPQVDSRKLIYQYSNDDNTTIAICVYPDTLQWVKENNQLYLDPFTFMYFWHPAYDNYPVVGISWDQANAYCHWKTEQLKNKIPTDKIHFKIPQFRLPTELEWEFAATGSNTSFPDYVNAYPWDSQSLNDEKGIPYSNSGIVKDINSVLLKQYSDDKFLTTSIVKYYKQNDFGLYDMGGNVAEWVNDTASSVSLKNYFGCTNSDFLPANMNYEITENDNIHTLLKRIVEIQNQIPDASKIDTSWQLNKDRLFIDIEKLLHDWNIVSNQKFLHIVKGGSWADSPVYEIISMNQVLPEKYSSCKVGFRLAMNVTAEMLPYFYTNKYPIDPYKKKKSKRKKQRLYC